MTAFGHKAVDLLWFHRSWGGGQGVHPPEKSQNIGFYTNTGLDPLKITKLRSQLSMLGPHTPASETPFKVHFAGRPMMAYK